ncbi:hypothetical protein [Romboutsia sp. 1001713B170207_170306_H8]|uniref:hypothetical protein n=1 Tax=Romboutsia sp. 1001713B170207_170306_H8 TaxID=2787112 RepID=UPI00189B271A|nr:hypothetical protein [Romboutsia sp. 1001713B170207_170306_H8]
MEVILSQLNHITVVISNVIWPIFIPFLLLMGIYICAQVILNIRSLTTEKREFSIMHLIPQASVSLGAMMGTGIIIGFLSALSNLYVGGQVYVESVALWALIGSLVLIPISYCETLIAKIVNMDPRDYIEKFVSKGAAKIYVIALILLYVFAIGGVQFSGMDAIIITSLDKISGIKLTQMQQYLFVIIPIIFILFVVVLKNRQDIFIKSMVSMILVAAGAYFVFFGIFLIKTHIYVPAFIERMLIGFKNPVSMLFGIPLGLIFGMQRVIQIAEPGLGTLPLAAVKTNSSPRVAASISAIMTTFLVVISVLVTSYIASYGVDQNIISFTENSAQRLVSYFETVISVTGILGLAILFIFIILSGMTTLLGSYYLLSLSSKINIKNRNIMYLSMLLISGILSIFKFEILFNLLNILLFVATSLNIGALAMFVEFEWSKYKLNKNNKKQVA